jgi:hypothetical protein
MGMRLRRIFGTKPHTAIIGYSKEQVDNFGPFRYFALIGVGEIRR